MTDLTAFLSARLDEDKQRASDIHHAECWSCSPDRFPLDSTCTCDTPARALREVQAKRNILGRHAPYPDHPAYCEHCNDGLLQQRWPCEDVLVIAAVYVDHPDYRPEEWKL